MTATQRVIATAIATGIFLAAISHAECSYLQQDHERQQRPVPERIIPPPPPPRNDISRLISRIRVGRPFICRNLTIFPLQLSRPYGDSDYKTLDESLSRGYIEILEEKNPEVRGILVRNNSRYYLFLMAGESLAGGKQNRLISEDVLLAPHGRPVRIPVYCIERRRWSQGRPELSSGGFVAPSSMRRMAREKASQRAVWDAVSGLLEETGSRSENEDLSAVFKNKSISGELALYRRELGIPLRDTVGCVAVIRGRIVAADVFSSPNLFGKLWRKLLDSYVLDAIPRHRRPWPAAASEEEVRRFLDRVFRASFRERSARDAGRIVDVAGRGIDGEGLIFRRDVVHVHLTPRGEVRF